jgi:hypothetical protein
MEKFRYRAQDGYLQDSAGISIKKIVQILREAHPATIEINGEHLSTLNSTNPPRPASPASNGHQRRARSQAGAP